MPNPADLLPKAAESRREQKVQSVELREGIIDSTPANDTQLVWIRVPTFHRNHRWGPCPWVPRLVDGVSYSTPAKGDRALIAVSSEGEPWVIQWWPQEYGS